MKKLSIIICFIFSLILCFGCENNSAAKTIKNSNTIIDCADCYFLLSGDYGKRVFDRNAVLTNTFYHLTNSDVDTLNSFLPLIISSYACATEKVVENKNESFPKLLNVAQINYPNLNKNENLEFYFNKTTLTKNNLLNYEINGVMHKPTLNKEINNVKKPALEELLTSIKNKTTTTIYENDIGDATENEDEKPKKFSPEKLYSVSATITNHNGSTQTNIAVYESDNTKNYVKLKYSHDSTEKEYVVNKNGVENKITINNSNNELTAKVESYNSEVDYTFKINKNSLDFTFLKHNSNVHALKNGKGRITLNNSKVIYHVSSDLKFEKHVNSAN